MEVVYLHGFASSSASSKAAMFRERLAPYGIACHCPDLNDPDFSTLTITRMLGQVERLMAAIDRQPIVLVGSSLGGYVAWHAAARAAAAGTPVDRLVLMAPAFEFGRRDAVIGPAEIEEWRRTGWRVFHHYVYDEPRRVHYELFADAQQYDPERAAVDAPTLIFQGRHDEVVDPAMVERFAAARPNCRVRLLDDGHQLAASMETVWEESAAFLGLTRA
ncbi:MAG: alpha/beta fold hydrolase [Vicinamibacteraceae bacterium]|nr:alpha/beta fold hydrolase [Vicinamibacteraceae bacterium]